MDRVLCVGMDMDDLRYYRGIHALPQRLEEPIIFTVALGRFLQLCESIGIPTTLFVIAKDMQWEDASFALGQAVKGGHEIASHSLEHSYALSKMPLQDIVSELAKAKEMLEKASGQEIIGFRGPGYNLSQNLLQALAVTNHQYDSSIMAAPAYWTARAMVIAAMRCLGKKSASIVGRARDFFRTGRPFTWDLSVDDNAYPLWEFPISTALQIPVIGTVLARGTFNSMLVSACQRRPFVNVEFHALDFLDIDEDGLESELRVEPALQVPLAQRMQRFERTLKDLSKDRRHVLLQDLVPPSPNEQGEIS